MSTVTAEQRRPDGGPTPKKMGKIAKKAGRPTIPESEKKIRVVAYITPEIVKALEDEIENGNGSNLSGVIGQILKRHFQKRQP